MEGMLAIIAVLAAVNAVLLWKILRRPSPAPVDLSSVINGLAIIARQGSGVPALLDRIAVAAERVPPEAPAPADVPAIQVAACPPVPAALAGMVHLLKTVQTISGQTVDASHGMIAYNSAAYHEALATPGLKVRLADGTIEEGIQ